jgi:predicted ester cyclase
MDLAGVAELAIVFYGAFPDIRQTVEAVVSDENMAALRFSATGTRTGELMGMPPTGKRINISGMCMFQITHGKVTEWAEVFDQMSFPALGCSLFGEVAAHLRIGAQQFFGCADR